MDLESFVSVFTFAWSGIVYSIAPSGLGFTSTHVLLENGSGYMCKSNQGASSAVLLIKLCILSGTLMVQKRSFV